jgi:hypothetical protein
MPVMTGENKLQAGGKNGKILKDGYTKGLHTQYTYGSDKNERRDTSEVSIIATRHMACSQYSVFFK